MIIKVCGMCNPENIQQVAGLGIHWMGFIFYEKSPRYLRLSTLPPLSSTKKVGVFVNATHEEMLQTAVHFQLDYLQLHGEESPEDCYALQKRGFDIIKAFPITTVEDLKKTQAYTGYADYFLFDTRCNGYGGSGKSFDWSILNAYTGETPFILSGGIRPESLTSLQHFHHPCLAGIDLNSGFEIEPGLKDLENLKHFINEIKRS